MYFRPEYICRSGKGIGTKIGRIEEVHEILFPRLLGNAPAGQAYILRYRQRDGAGAAAHPAGAGEKSTRSSVSSR